jgi:legumain
MLSILIATVTLLSAGGTFAATGQNWAVIVAGSNGYYNYRHQADVCHAYQILHKHGIPDTNIVVMMYDDIANNAENPTKGVIINHPNGQDVYKGVPKDYIGKTVTPKNFINVLLGKKDLMKGIGSGKVLESGPDDNVFVYFTDHGAVGLVAFPNGVLYAKDLNKTITEMHTQKKYKQMVIYIEACESGSMLDTLPSDINIYSTTASNAEESSYACYYDAKRQTYLGDLYSVNWMENTDAEDITKESLFKQFEATKKKTNLSHVMQYGDLAFGKEHNVSEFQGAQEIDKQELYNPFADQMSALLQADAVATVDVRTSILKRRLAALPADSNQRVSIQNKLADAIHQKNIIGMTIDSIAQQAFQINGDFDKVMTQRMKLTEDDCYISATQRIHEKCFDIQNEYVLNKLWIVANLCQVGIRDFTINNAVDAVCNEIGRQKFDY